MANPFDPYGPVTEMEKFFGRAEYVQEILSGIRTPVSYAVIGGRRIGKTSLLNYIVRKIELKNQSSSDLTLIPVDISLHGTTPRSRRAFFNTLIKKLVGCLNTQHNSGLSPQAFMLPSVSEDDFDLDVVLELLLDIIQQSMAGLGDIRIVFLIDEIEYLMDKPFADDLISNLRHIISNHPVRENISFVMFGDRYLYEIADIKGSPLENVIRTLQLRAFNERESFELIHTPTGNRLEQNLAQNIVQLSNGHLCIIQHLMYRLVESDLTLTKAIDLQNACADFLQKSRIFHHWLKHFTDLDKRVYYAFARYEDKDSASFSFPIIHSMFPSESLSDCLDKLFYYGLLHKPTSDSYHAIIGLFAEWFRTRFSETAENLTFNLDLNAYNECLDAVKKRYSRQESDAKGKALENLARLLLGSCVGLTVETRVNTASGEIDLLVHNQNRTHPFLSMLGEYFICECKNWEKKAGVQLIQTFVHRIKTFECTLGLYFSKRGITGNIAANAKKEIHDLYRDEKRFFVVLTLDDLNSIGQGRDFLEMLEEKKRDIQFQRI
ncbi:ATP-binding protein [Candidatus Poribacteria bacterium]|nr:ATP-binding protein [Candidatus Poribacteria bacterium]